MLLVVPPVLDELVPDALPGKPLLADVPALLLPMPLLLPTLPGPPPGPPLVPGLTPELD